jgi:mannosyltransferase
VLAARWLPDWALVVPPAATLAMMLWGIGGPSYWRDEADTISAASRSLPQLIRLLGHVDAVHGLYYLLLWPVARVAGTGEAATRLPSALAMAAAALGIAVIARRLASRRAALCAGLLFAALPEVSVQGHDARPYAMVTAAAVLASYLLLRAVEDPRWARFAGYGLSLVLLGYLHLFALLLVPAHAITLAAFGRKPGRLCRRWLASVAAAGAVMTPLVVIGWSQRGQIGWIPRPGWHEAGLLVTALAGGTAGSVALIGVLAALGSVRGGQPASTVTGAGHPIGWLAVPWLIVPPAVLLAASMIKPVYYLPYVIFCLPAVALAGGCGLAALGWPARAAAAVLLAALITPTQLAIRAPDSGGALRPADQILAANERPGDAVIYPQGGIPPWYLAYPDGFGRLRDIGLRQTGPAAGRLYGTSEPLPILLTRECGVRRLWVIEIGPHWRNPAGLAPGFRLARQWQPHGAAMRLWLYQRPGPVAIAGPASPSAASSPPATWPVTTPTTPRADNRHLPAHPNRPEQNNHANAPHRASRN